MSFPEPKERIQKIKEAVKSLNSHGRRVSISSVAGLIGVSHAGLSMWLMRHSINPQNLDIPPKKIVDKEKRIAGIKDAVKKLKQKNDLETISNVARELCLYPSSLSGWAKKENIDFEKFGILGRDKRNKLVNDRRLQEFKEIAKELKVRNEKPSIGKLAERMNLTGSGFSLLMRKNNIDLTSLLKRPYQRVSNRQRASRIKKIVRELRKEGLVPHIYNIAARLGIDNRTLYDWYKSSGVKRETLGIVHGQIDSNQRILRIKKIVRNLKNKNRMPNLTAVSKELGVTASTMVIWAKRNKIDLKSLGVVWRNYNTTGNHNIVKLENKIFFNIKKYNQ